MTESAPLVAADVDLRGYEFMPLYGGRLYGSDFNARVSDAGFRAAMSLWWQAWNQIPAASLPNDDVVLTKLADLGRDLKAFRKVKAEALDGFIACSDGRLYHPQLAVWAREAWERRLKERERKAHWRASKGRGQDGDNPRDNNGTGGGTETGQAAGRRRDVPSEGKGSEVKRSEAKGSDVENRDVKQTPDISARATAGNGKPAIEKTRDGNGQKWDDSAWVTATGRTAGVEKRTGEDFAAYRDRVYAALQDRIRLAKAQAGGNA